MLNRWIGLSLLATLGCASPDQSASIIPKIDPDEFCRQYETCYKELRYDADKQLQLLSLCSKFSHEDNVRRAVFNDGCKQLEGCTFVVCMKLHMEAPKTAIDVVETMRQQAREREGTEPNPQSPKLNM